MATPTFAPLPEAVVAQFNAVSTATISHQLATRGLTHTFMAGLAPLRPDLRLCGRAVTLRYIPVRADLFKQKKEDANAQRQLIESIGAGEVLVIDARGMTASATIGNILSTRVRRAARRARLAAAPRYPAIKARTFQPTRVAAPGATPRAARAITCHRDARRALYRRCDRSDAGA